MEEGAAPKVVEQYAEATRVLDEELAAMEEVLRVMEKQDQQELDEARQAGLFQIGVEIAHEVVVEALAEDPFHEEDADKENWNPQILRNVGGDRGAV